MSESPKDTMKHQQMAERAYSNQSRKDLSSDHDYNERMEKPYANRRVSVAQQEISSAKHGEVKESPLLHQKEEISTSRR